MAEKVLDMVTPVTADTFARLNFSAGMVAHDIDLSKVADAEALAALLQTNAANSFGATKGNPRIDENRSYWSASFNGKRMPYKGDTRFDSARPTLGVTLVEFTPSNQAAASGAATVETNGNVTTVQPLADIKEGSYYSNVLFIGNNGTDGLYVAELKNALCVSSGAATFTDKDIASFDVEFAAHANNPADIKHLPIKYYFFKAPVD